jgi:type IV secretion system protein VirD4
VNQLPQDDGILFVGGLLPYRARKVRYFLDPRFKARGALPPPDRPDEQARELLARAPSEWLDCECVPGDAAPCPPPSAPHAAATTPTEAEPHVALDEREASLSPAAESAAPHDVWAGYFPDEAPEGSTPEGAEPEAAAQSERKDLPV